MVVFYIVTTGWIFTSAIVEKGTSPTLVVNNRWFVKLARASVGEIVVFCVFLVIWDFVEYF